MVVTLEAIGVRRLARTKGVERDSSGTNHDESASEALNCEIRLCALKELFKGQALPKSGRYFGAELLTPTAEPRASHSLFFRFFEATRV